MVWPTVSKEHEPLFHAALPDDPRVEVKRMMGTVVGTVNGHMFTALWADTVMVRLSPADRGEVLATGGEPFDPRRRGVISDMVLLPAKVMREPAALRGWLRKALTAMAARPPKAKKGTMRARKAAATKPAKA